MTKRRPLAVALALILAAPAGAQVRPVPAAAAAEPLASAAAGAAASRPLAGPLAPALLPAGAPPLVPVAAAPAANEDTPAARAEGAVARAVPAPAFAPLPAALPADAARRAPAARRSRAVRPSRPAARRAAAALPAAVSADAAPAAAALDALFDGRAPAAASLPESEGPPPARLSPARPRLSRARRALGVGLPVAAGAAALGLAAPHLALAGVAGLGQAAYWLANPLAFLFTVPQLHRMIKHRSGSVSVAMTGIGLVSALAVALCFAFDGKDLMMYRNLAQAIGFAAMLGLEWRYARAPAGPRPSRRRALALTVALSVALTAALGLAGPALMAVMPGVAAMGWLLVPFQVLAGFGFTHMMYAQLMKMLREHSAGDSSGGMMWAFFGTKTIWLWSFAMMLSLLSAPAWLTLPAGALFAGTCWLASRAVLSRLLRAPWAFLPESVNLLGRRIGRGALGDAAAFAVLSALILGLSAAGWFAASAFLGVPAASASLFAMYLIYMVQNLVACVATLKALTLRARLRRES